MAIYLKATRDKIKISIPAQEQFGGSGRNNCLQLPREIEKGDNEVNISALT